MSTQLCPRSNDSVRSYEGAYGRVMSCDGLTVTISTGGGLVCESISAFTLGRWTVVR